MQKEDFGHPTIRRTLHESCDRDKILMSSLSRVETLHTHHQNGLFNGFGIEFRFDPTLNPIPQAINLSP